MSDLLHERLARPGLDRLWRELIRRWEASARPVTSVSLRELTDPERHAIADLMATDRLPFATCSVSVRKILQSLGVSVDELKAALAHTRGPWRSRADERAERARERGELEAWLVAAGQRLGVPGCCERVRARGIIGGEAAAFRVRLSTAFDVIERLPALGVPLAGFACDVLGDPHALDYGTWLSSVVLDAIAERSGMPLAASAEDARRLWSLAGVAADGLSSSVLCLALAPETGDALAVFLRESAAASEPAALTMSQLQRWPVRQCPPIVHAFENPSILAEAARNVWQGPPLVCTAGWPNVAALTLLRQLIETGARIRYHGDFDSKGLSIAQMLVERLSVDPWRMTAADYEAELGRARVPIVGGVPDSGWDPALSVSMRTHRLAVFEEDVRGKLLTAIRPR